MTHAMRVSVMSTNDRGLARQLAYKLYNGRVLRPQGLPNSDYTPTLLASTHVAHASVQKLLYFMSEGHCNA